MTAPLRTQPLHDLMEQFSALHHRSHEGETKRVAIIASKGTLDMAYPALILASTAASLGMECAVFFTFYGLTIVHKRKSRSLRVAPLGNPAAPIPVPTLLGALPGMTHLATFAMRWMMRRRNMPSVPALLATARGMGVKLFACSTTMGVMGVKASDLVEGVEVAGAASFLEFASKAHITLFI
jgi:peroxiredoxin family protein